MTIRVTCDKCASVLKIKDELAGTDGKCPKCKTRFIVPQPTAEDSAEDAPSEVLAASTAAPKSSLAKESSPPEEPPAAVKAPSKPTAKSPEKPAAKPAEKPGKKPAVEAEFDLDSFLMDGPKKKPSLDSTPEPTSRSPMPGGSPSRNGGGGFSLDDDESAPDPAKDSPAPTRKWGAKKEGSAAAAADSSLGSTNAAKDLLAKSMEESRVRASQMPEEEPRFNFDIAGLIREIGVKGIGSVVGVIVAVFGLWWVMNNMMGSKLKLPPLGYVSGTVTIGGKPAVGVKVYLTPINSEIEGAKKKEIARDSIGLTDAEGNFVLYYSEDIQGAKVGDCRLWMEASDPRIVIPPSHGVRSAIKVDVKRGTNPPQKIEL